MNSADAPPETNMLVPGAHRVIRLLDADEGPYAGALVTDRDSVAVMTDADALSGWAGWAHAGDDHVAGPVDLVRRADGHDVLLPWCTERITVFLGRREAAAETLSAGEVSTLVGSLLRGLDELGHDVPGTEIGEWWLTDDGRPLFVIGTGDDARLSAAKLIDLVHRVTVDRTSARLLAGIRDGLRKDSGRPGVPPRQLRLWETELFAIAAPRPLRRDAHAPERVRDIEMVRSLRAVPIESRRDARAAARATESRDRGPAVRGIVVTVIASLRLAMRRIVERCVRLTIRGSKAQRTSAVVRGHAHAEREDAVGAPSRSARRYLVAGVAAASILMGGLLWPVETTGEAPDADRAAPDSPEGAATGAAEPDGGPTTAPSDDAPLEALPSASAPGAGSEGAALEDPVQAAPSLLAAIRVCADAGDDACGGAVAPGSTAVHDIAPAGSAGATGAQEDFALVDSYGDVAVVRITTNAGGAADSPSITERMLVLVNLEEKWLVRDAYDVADQPR